MTLCSCCWEIIEFCCHCQLTRLIVLKVVLINTGLTSIVFMIFMQKFKLTKIISVWISTIILKSILHLQQDKSICYNSGKEWCICFNKNVTHKHNINCRHKDKEHQHSMHLSEIATSAVDSFSYLWRPHLSGGCSACIELSATRDSGLLLTFDIPEGDQVSPFSSVIRLTWRRLLRRSADVCI